MLKASRIHYLFGTMFCFWLQIVTAKLLCGKHHGMPRLALASLLGYMEEQAKRAYAIIDAKRKVAHFQHLPAVLLRSAVEAYDLR
jgi:hypothetical protein